MSTFNFTELVNQLNDATARPAQCVSFANKSLKLDTEEDAIEIIRAIEACPCLEILDLEGNTLGAPAAKAIANALKVKGIGLKRALWKDMFTGRLKSEIPEALQYLGTALCIANTHLVELNLSDNALGPIGIEGLATFLSSSPCYSLQELRLNNNGLGIFGAKMLAQALSDCYENSCKEGLPLALRVFVAGRNRLENAGAQVLATVFEKFTSLEEVVMLQNGIYHAGIVALAKALSFNTGLRILNLDDNTIGIKGARALANVLPTLENLEQLHLGDCLLKTKGALMIVDALKPEGTCNALKELNLGFNEIHTQAVRAIAEAVGNKKSLESLQLDGNHFKSEGCALLREYLTKSAKIEALKSLSEDESEDEDEDANDEHSESESDESNNENVEEDESEIEAAVSESSITESDKAIVEFIKLPSGEKLLLLPNDCVEAFVAYAKNSITKSEGLPVLRFIEELTQVIVKVSAFCSSGYVDIRVKAESITDDLYAELFAFAIENNEISNLNNTLLINLGLLKSEHKHIGKVDWNLEGCFKALERVCQRDYFLTQTKESLILFLEKPTKAKTNKRANVVEPLQDSKMCLKAVLTRTQNT